MTTLLKGVFSAIWLLCNVSLIAKDTVCPYYFNFPQHATNWRLLLPAPFASTVYSDSKVAVDLQSVICDRTELRAEIAPPSEPPRTKSIISAAPGRIVYEFTLGFFESWVSLKKSDALYELKHFYVPEDARIIDVRYKIRFPDGSTSELLRAIFVASDQDAQFVVLPKDERSQQGH